MDPAWVAVHGRWHREACVRSVSDRVQVVPGRAPWPRGRSQWRSVAAERSRVSAARRAIAGGARPIGTMSPIAAAHASDTDTIRGIGDMSHLPGLDVAIDVRSSLM